MGNWVAAKPREHFRRMVTPNAHRIEAAWAADAINTTVREMGMGPGMRREALDLWGDGGYSKFENRARRGKRREKVEGPARKKLAVYGFLLTSASEITVHAEAGIEDLQYIVCVGEVGEKLNGEPHLRRPTGFPDDYRFCEHRVIGVMLREAKREQAAINAHIRVLKKMIRCDHRRRLVSSTGLRNANRRKDIQKRLKTIHALKERRERMDLCVSYDICCRWAENAVARGEGGFELLQQVDAAFHLPQIPSSCLCEILRLLNPSNQATAILVSHRFAHIARAELYRVVEVEGDRAPVFFSALKSRQELGALVHKLTLAGTKYKGDNYDGLQQAFSSFVNLRSLHIHYMRLGFAHVLKNIPGQVEDLLYWPTVCNNAIDFLLSQPHIKSALFDDLNLAANIPSLLPHLTDITAPPEDLAIIVPSRPVKYVDFHYSDADKVRRPIISLKFLSLSSAPILSLELQISQLVAASKDVPELHVLLPAIRRLVIYQDKLWGSAFIAANDFSRSIDTMVAALDQLTTLRHLAIACTYSNAEAQMIRRKFVCNSHLDLEVQVIGTKDSLLYWTDMMFCSEYVTVPLEAAAARYVNNLRY
ncbi:hypothetical protein R3P38DRAFT_2775578 [Favolaschia claudopus]|uniref:F-box domain-containing protein n=1 Tax=Favolaschia claudopus TaxID=2862362 RepID=A0AAW0BTX1_9AGAR